MRRWASLRRGQPPAAGAARQAELLLLEGRGRGIEQAEHLIQRLAGGGIAVGEPALAGVRAARLVAAPIGVFARIITQVCGDRVFASRSPRRGRPYAAAFW